MLTGGDGGSSITNIPPRLLLMGMSIEFKGTGVNPDTNVSIWWGTGVQPVDYLYIGETLGGINQVIQFQGGYIIDFYKVPNSLLYVDINGQPNANNYFMVNFWGFSIATVS